MLLLIRHVTRCNTIERKILRNWQAYRNYARKNCNPLLYIFFSSFILIYIYSNTNKTNGFVFFRLWIHELFLGAFTSRLPFTHRKLDAYSITPVRIITDISSHSKLDEFTISQEG